MIPAALDQPIKNSHPRSAFILSTSAAFVPTYAPSTYSLCRQRGFIGFARIIADNTRIINDYFLAHNLVNPLCYTVGLSFITIPPNKSEFTAVQAAIIDATVSTKKLQSLY